MSTRVRSQVVLVASLDTDEKQVHFERSDATLNGAIATHAAEASDHLTLAAAEADYALPLGKVVTGQYLYIETDTELGLKLDGSADEQILKPPASGVSARFSAHMEFTTAPLVTNKDATAVATMSYFIAGALT
jgi:hypothetical protein